jgi:hypothetical protein
MDDSAFKSILDALDANRIALDRWLEFWTWLVIVGVAFELVFIIWDHIEEIREWYSARSRAMVPAPGRPSRVKLIFELLSVALVVIGIAGELRVDAMLGKLETDIRDTNERRVLRLQKEAGDAADASERAQQSADKSEADERSLNAKLSEATRKEEAEQARLEQEERKTSDLQGKAVEAQATLEKFVNEATTKLAPRGGVERNNFVDALKGKSNHVHVDLWYEPNNLEAYVFAWDLYRALGVGQEKAPGAGWSVTPPTPIPNDTQIPAAEPGSRRIHFFFKTPAQQQIFPTFIVDWRDPGEPLIAQFNGAWSDGGVTVLSRNSNDATSGALAEAIAKSASLSIVEQPWHSLDPDRIIVVVTNRLTTITR